VPTPDALTTEGLQITREAMEELLRVDSSDWMAGTEETANSSRNSATGRLRNCGRGMRT
jgi:GTP-dependent phosphoenolpyruvate carboxykinase